MAEMPPALLGCARQNDSDKLPSAMMKGVRDKVTTGSTDFRNKETNAGDIWLCSTAGQAAARDAGQFKSLLHFPSSFLQSNK